MRQKQVFRYKKRGVVPHRVILGREQSGSINRVGLNLYCQMLNEAVEELKIGS